MTCVGRLRERSLWPGIEAAAAFYAEHDDPARRRAWQLEALNREWSRITAEIPYYRELVAEGVPRRFESLEAFVEAVPATTRERVHREGARMASSAPAPDFQRMTGGSTAEPVQLPAWNREQEEAQPETWLGRTWYGVRPSSRLFMLWGHAHLLGTGRRGWINARRREVSDWLLGYRRFSAYDLSDAKLREAARALAAFRPDWMLGYSVALDRFARANADAGDALRATGLEMVVGTAESFPAEDSAARLEALFAAPVAMEYGCVEAGLLAHTHPDGGYRVFWGGHLLEVEPGTPGRGAVRVTSLRPRCFPLVRYELGDDLEFAPGADTAPGFDRFERVAGRCNDFVVLGDGAVIHSEVFSHAVRPSAGVDGYQVVQRDGMLCLRLVATLDAAGEAAIQQRLARIHPELGAMRIERVDRLEQTVAGKTRMIVRE
jgi:phenylacetate-coenzyme A ligase PaaK-like adenylate-forming protein